MSSSCIKLLCKPPSMEESCTTAHKILHYPPRNLSDFASSHSSFQYISSTGTLCEFPGCAKLSPNLESLAPGFTWNHLPQSIGVTDFSFNSVQVTSFEKLTLTSCLGIFPLVILSHCNLLSDLYNSPPFGNTVCGSWPPTSGHYV